MLLFLGRKRFLQSSGEFINENDTVDNGEKKASTDSINGPPKLEDYGGAFPQRGSKESSGTGLIEDKRRTYMKKKKKQAFERDEKRKEHDPERTERTKHTAHRADSRGMVFPIIFAAVSIGFVMLVCVGAAFAWMWYVLIFILHLAHA